MTIQALFTCRNLFLALTTFLLITLAVFPNFAQTGNQSDATGPILSTSDFAGQTLQSSTTTTTFPGGENVQFSVNQAANIVNTRLGENNFSISESGEPIPITIQQAVLSILTSDEQASANINLLAISLSTTPGAPPLNVIQNLLSSLEGLTQNNQVAPDRLLTAVRAYNEVIQKSDEEFRNPPPKEILTIKAVIAPMVKSANTASSSSPIISSSGTEVLVSNIEQNFTTKITSYSEIQTSIESQNLEQIQNNLSDIEKKTGVKPAILYAFFMNNENIESLQKQYPMPQEQKGISKAESDSHSRIDYPKIAEFLPKSGKEKDDDRLMLILVTKANAVFSFSEVSRQTIYDSKGYLISDLNTLDNLYLDLSQKYYNYLIKPVEKTLESQQIKNIVFIVDQGLRGIPFAGLHDGQDYIIKNYSVKQVDAINFNRVNILL
jgi:hypothetical protein